MAILPLSHPTRVLMFRLPLASGGRTLPRISGFTFDLAYPLCSALNNWLIKPIFYFIRLFTSPTQQFDSFRTSISSTGPIWNPRPSAVEVFNNKKKVYLKARKLKQQENYCIRFLASVNRWVWTLCIASYIGIICTCFFRLGFPSAFPGLLDVAFEALCHSLGSPVISALDLTERIIDSRST